MSWYIHHTGERGNRCYAEILELDYRPPSFGYQPPYPIYGPYPTKEEAIKTAERRGLTLHSLTAPEGNE